MDVQGIALEPRRSLGQGCCVRVDVELSTVDVQRLSAIAKVLGDPVRLQIVDILRRHPGEVCVCDLQPLFEISQPTLSHHLKRLRDAGLVGVVRREQWAYYYVLPDALEVLKRWLDSGPRASDRTPESEACCSPAALAACCEPSAKDACCGASDPAAPPARCGCTPA